MAINEQLSVIDDSDADILGGLKVRAFYPKKTLKRKLTWLAKALAITVIVLIVIWKVTISVVQVVPAFASSDDEEVLSDQDLMDLLDPAMKTTMEALLLQIRFANLTEGATREWMHDEGDIELLASGDPRLILEKNLAHELMVRAAAGSMLDPSATELEQEVPELEPFFKALSERSAVISTLCAHEKHAIAFESWEEVEPLFEVFSNRSYPHTIWAMTCFLEAGGSAISALVESGELSSRERESIATYLKKTGGSFGSRIDNNIAYSYVQARDSVFEFIGRVSKRSNADWSGMHPVQFAVGSVKVKQSFNQLQVQFRKLHDAFQEPYADNLNVLKEEHAYLFSASGSIKSYISGNLLGESAGLFAFPFFLDGQDVRVGKVIATMRLQMIALELQDYEARNGRIPVDILEIDSVFPHGLPVSPFAASHFEYLNATRELVLSQGEFNEEIRIKF